MTHAVAILVLGGLALVRGWHWWGRRDTPLWRAALDTCIITLAIAFPLMWDRGATGGEVAGIGFVVMTLGFAIQLVTATSARIYSRAFRHPSTRLRDCWDLILTHVAFTILLLGSWMTSPLIHSQGPLDAYAGPQPASVALYKIASWGWVILALCDVGIVSVAGLRSTSRISWPGLITISAAFFLAAEKLLIELATVLPGSDPHWYRLGLDQQPSTAIILAFGLLILFGLPALRDRLEPHRALRTLTPLWNHVTTRHPYVRLDVPANFDTDERLARYAIETRDALTRTSTQLAPGASLDTIACELAGPEPSHTGRYVVDLLPRPSDEHADLEQLLHLARALRRYMTKEP